MRGEALRFTNTLLFALVCVLTLTGLQALFFNGPAWVMDVHRVAGWSLLALLPTKAVIIFNSLRRGLDLRFKRSVVVAASVLLAGMALLVIGLGLVWLWRIGPELLWLWQTAVAWHWMLALALLAPFAFHVWQRWPRPKRADLLSRRSALKLAGFGLAGIAGWLMAEAIAQRRALSAAPRRFTGSREAGSFTGNAFPITNSVFETARPIDLAQWVLIVHGVGRSPLRLTYSELLALPTTEKIATLDCTNGWYSTQVWRGVMLTDVLQHGGRTAPLRAVRLIGNSGYWGLYTAAEAQEILLATHVGGEVLSHDHGFPVRAVVPSRRGWFWIKWLATLEAF